jgi:AraC-like DNA-binding protein
VRSRSSGRASSPYTGGVSSADIARWTPGYREWLPPAAVRSSLSCLWVSVIAAHAGPAVTDVLPDGCVDLIWQSGHGGYIAGPDTGPAPAELPAGTIIVGARFRPGAGGPALGLPLARLRDQRVDLADCLPGLARQLPAELSADAALALVTGLSCQLASDSPPDLLVLHGTRLLASGRTTVAQLGTELTVSERQLRRRFDAAVGYGPKTLHRVLRFRHALAQLSVAARPADLASLALQAGYADQAHLTREMTRLAGQPPGALARVLRPL